MKYKPFKSWTKKEKILLFLAILLVALRLYVHWGLIAMLIVLALLLLALIMKWKIDNI